MFQGRIQVLNWEGIFFEFLRPDHAPFSFPLPHPPHSYCPYQGRIWPKIWPWLNSATMQAGRHGQWTCPGMPKENSVSRCVLSPLTGSGRCTENWLFFWHPWPQNIWTYNLLSHLIHIPAKLRRSLYLLRSLFQSQAYLSTADTLYSGHLAIADKKFWSRQNPYMQNPI